MPDAMKLLHTASWRFGDSPAVELFLPLVLKGVTASSSGRPSTHLDMSNYLSNYVYMNKINIAEARAGFSRHLARVEAGETITLCRRNVPIAELRPIRPHSTEPRPIGIDRGMVVPHAFFDPLPDDILRAFGGGDGGREDGARDDGDECEGADRRDEVRPGT